MRLETHGPDPRKPTLRSLRYHERPPYQEGREHSCSCCDPCLYIRIGMNRDLMHLRGPDPVLPTAECCRCIPRALFFRFTPTDEEEDCCYPYSVFVIPELVPGPGQSRTWLHAVYSANIGGYLLKLKVGRFQDDEYEDCTEFQPPLPDDPYDKCMGYCAWIFEAWHRPTPLDDFILIHSEEFPLEPGDPQCLFPPDISFGPIEGPRGCSGGHVTFHQLIKDKLPYVPRLHPDFDPEVYQPKFIDLCPSDCGTEIPECVSVQDGNIIRQYERIADIGGYPAYSFGVDEAVKIISWDDSEEHWILTDINNEVLATGGENPDCPLGVWYLVGDDYDYYDYYYGGSSGTAFCVSLCHTDEDPFDTPVSFICGECRQACSRVCVSGNWRGESWQFLEFTWFKKLVGTGGGEFTIEQGWVSDEERLLLEHSGRSCVLTPDFDGHGSGFAPITITSGCSCKLYESSQETPLAGGPYWFSVHCGICSCYDFYCGSCRCVPAKMCVHWVLDGEYSGPHLLTWDEEKKQWGDEDVDWLIVKLERGEGGRCEAVPYIQEGYEHVPLYLWNNEVDGDAGSPWVHKRQWTEFDCRKEMYPIHTSLDFPHPQVDPEPEGIRLTSRIKSRRQTDFLAITHDGFLAEHSRPFYLYGATFYDDCIPSFCNSIFAQACPDECLDHPSPLYATVIGWGDSPDTGYPEQKWAVEIELHMLLEITGPTNVPPATHCSYIGYKAVECDLGGTPVVESWRVSSREGGLSLFIQYWEKSGDDIIPRLARTFFDEIDTQVFCDPLYIETVFKELSATHDAIEPAVYCSQSVQHFYRATTVQLIITK